MMVKMGVESELYFGGYTAIYAWKILKIGCARDVVAHSVCLQSPSANSNFKGFIQIFQLRF